MRSFRLLVGRKLLSEGERRVRLGSRALDILIALVERAGEIVEKEELIGYVWPNTFVDEANLRVHVAALRKALGDGQEGARYIINTSGRGYSFVAPVKRIKADPPNPEWPAARPPANNLPTLLTRMIGRDDALYAVVEQLPHRRLLTIVGPGGIGKTTLALAVAERLLDAYENGVCFVDLAPLADSGLASALASSLGLPILSVDAVPSLIAFLAEQRRLIVLDRCEHVIEASARLVEALVKGCHGVNFLATSREPLRAEGEHVYRLPALDTPMPGGGTTAEEAMAFSSVRLFAERASSSLDTFELDDASAPIVSDICSRLDGVPLAIELAAAHIGVFGVRGLAERLSDVPFLTQGRRTAFPTPDIARRTGAMNFYRKPSGKHCGASLCSPEISPCRRRSPSPPKTKPMPRTSLPALASWSRNPWFSRTSAVPLVNTGCSTSPAPMRSRSLTKAASAKR